MTSTPLTGSWDDLVVVCGAVPWDGPRMTDHHLALGLARYGPVVYVDAPVPWRPNGGGGASRHGRPGSVDLVEVQPGLVVATPHVLPGLERPGIKRLTVALVRRAIRQAVEALGSPTVRAVVVTATEPYLDAVPASRRLYYATDDYVAGADLMGVPARRLLRGAHRRAAEADVVAATSPVLAETLRADGHQVLLVPNGCDPDVFARTDEAAPPADVQLPRPALGFMGHLSDRIDVRYLEVLVERGHPLLLVGPGPRAGLGPELAALVSRPNVHWTGPRPFADLPAHLSLVDVGLIPYTDTPFNHASFPLKALEYLAAGRPVLSTDIEAIHWLRRGENIGEPAAGSPVVTDDDIVAVGDPETFADEAERLLGLGLDPEAVARRRAFARTHSWEQRVKPLAEALGLTPPVDLSLGAEP